MAEEAHSSLDAGRRLARRRMAWVSFSVLMIEAGVLMAGLFVGDAIFVNNLNAAAPVLTGLFWAQAAVVGAYLGVSLTEAMKRN